MKFAAIVSYARRHRRNLWILIFLNAIYFFSYFQRVAIPGTIFNELQSDFSASASAVAMLGAIYLYIYGAMQLPAGIMADRLGARRVLLAGAFLLSLGSVIFPLARSISILYASRALVGLGAGLIFISIVKEIDNMFEVKDFAILLGVSLLLGYSGGLAGTYPFERAVYFFGWRQSLLAAGILCLILFFCGLFILKNKGYLRYAQKTSSPMVIRAILRNKNSYPVIFSGSVNFGIYFLVQATIGKKLLEDCYGLNSVTAASFTFIMMLMAMFFSFAAGFTSRAIGNRRKPIQVTATSLTLTTTALFLVCLGLKINGRWLLPGYILLGIASLASPIFSTLMKELNPPEAAGTSVGIINATCYLAVAIMTTSAGFALDCFKGQALRTATALIYPVAAYRTIFIGCLFLALSSFISSLYIRESRGQCIYDGKKE